MGRNPSPTDHMKDGLNKGAWTAMEDQILIDYVKVNGEGRWGRVSKQTSLRRCGKSCRLRWLNYLRPDIKRGNISHEEEELIIRLHKLLGNRWSLISGRLPGRTDNEIKNYWNTVLRKKLQLGCCEQPKDRIRKPKNEITIKDPCSEVAPSITPDQDHPVDHKPATSVSVPKAFTETSTISEADGAVIFPIASENDGCPWDFMANDHKLVEIGLSEFMSSFSLEAKDVYTQNNDGRQGEYEHIFYIKPCILSSSEDLQTEELSEEMLCQWTAELMY